jgi:outer membrane protein assembly factor BamB
LSQAVSAYGIVFTTEPKSHRVFARDAATGKERWSFIADGRTDYPPALQKGLCFFSTSAGSVYALDAATGKEVWRMRAAPVEKYIAEEGQFVSAWPVIGGVMPMNGELFFTCGRSVNVDGGIWMFAVEAATGKIRWRVKGGVSSGDFFLSDGKELVFNGNRYDVSTGKALGARAKPAKGILKTNTYFTQVALADYMACVEPALAHQKHIELTDGNVHGENLAFSDTLGVAAWNYRTGFHVPPGMMKKEKAGQPFIYAATGGKNNWLMDESLPQQMIGVILAGDTVYMAGVPTPASADQKPELWVLAGADGKKLQVIPLEARPVYDGLSTAGGRLFLATEDGHLLCFGAR